MQGFDTFGWQHLLWLLVLAAAGAAALSCVPARCRAPAAVLAVLGRVVPGVCALMDGSYGVASLPLHVCSLAGYGCLAHFLLTKASGTGEAAGDTDGKPAGKHAGKPAGKSAGGSTGKTAGKAAGILGELLYFPGLIGALMALLFPGWGYLPPFSLLSCCEFLGHFGIVLYVLSGLRSGAIAPSRMRIPVIFCILYALVMLPFDRAAGMNYGFLLVPAPDSPLSAIASRAGGGTGYYAGYAGLVLFFMACFYLPFRKRR